MSECFQLKKFVDLHQGKNKSLPTKICVWKIKQLMKYCHDTYLKCYGYILNLPLRLWATTINTFFRIKEMKNCWRQKFFLKNIIFFRCFKNYYDDSENKIYKQEEVNWCLQKCSLFIYISWQEKLSQKYSWELSPLTIIIEKKRKILLLHMSYFVSFVLFFPLNYII